jgi:hypothetical protein
VECRHTLIYRPFLQESGGKYGWEDCPLMDLLRQMPGTDEIEEAYTSFARTMRTWAGEIEKGRRSDDDDFAHAQWSEDLGGKTRNGPSHFLYFLFRKFKDRAQRRPTESLLLSYGRLLIGRDDETLLRKLREYRNAILEIDEWRGKPGLTYFDAKRAGSL